MSVSNIPLQSKDLQDAINSLNARLPKGITAELSIFKLKFSILYSVKFMHEGVRANLGKFSSYDAALNAMVNYKYKKFITISLAEVKEQESRILSITQESLNKAKMNENESIIETVHQELMELEAAKSGFNLGLMEAAYKEVPHKFEKGVTFDFYWKDAPAALADEQPLTGIFRITPTMVKKYQTLKKYESGEYQAQGKKEGIIELEELKSPLRENIQAIDDPEIIEMMKRIDGMQE